MICRAALAGSRGRSAWLRGASSPAATASRKTNVFGEFGASAGGFTALRALSVSPPWGDVVTPRWASGKAPSEWLFHAPQGGPLRETNWKRSVRWREAVAAIGRPTLRVHDLRHTAASVWLASGADPKVVQRVLGHAISGDDNGPLRASHRPELVVSRGATRGHLGDTR